MKKKVFLILLFLMTSLFIFNNKVNAEYLVNNNKTTLKLETIKISDLLKQLKEDYLFDLEEEKQIT